MSFVYSLSSSLEHKLHEDKDICMFFAHLSPASLSKHFLNDKDILWYKSIPPTFTASSVSQCKYAQSRLPPQTRIAIVLTCLPVAGWAGHVPPSLPMGKSAMCQGDFWKRFPSL